MVGVLRTISGGPMDTTVAGHWQITAYPPGKPAVDVSVFRGIPVKIGSFSFADPFGPTTMSLSVPHVSIFEEIGVGDLDWLSKHTDIDVTWVGVGPLPAAFYIAPPQDGDMRIPTWSWEGYIASFGRTKDGVALQLKGAMLQLDNWLAKPEYPSRPLPYEWAIARQMHRRPSLRLAPMRITWPAGWSALYQPTSGAPSYMIPSGVQAGARWTGLLTRSTGSWDPVLTGYIQSLLASMYDEAGRWTIDLDTGRQPVMFHRDFPIGPSRGMVVIDLALPGVTPDLNEDWEQSMTTVYGQGAALSGVGFSGMSVSADGSQTRYMPLASMRQTWPEQGENGWLDTSVMVKEVYLQMQAGLSQDDAMIVARSHLARFAEPGITGTLTLASDPVIDGVKVPRGLVRAGMNVYLPRALGRLNGVIAHITGSTYDVSTGVNRLEIDSKFRDALTSEEVRLRGRDALSISRMLIAGNYRPPVDDQMMPWSYPDGSGIIPSSPSVSAVGLFTDMPSQIAFPWTEWTTAHPPSSPRWKDSYLHLGPVSANADNNWIIQNTATGTAMGNPIKMSQAGTVRLLQVAAYDKYGLVLPIAFHVSFYYVGGVNVTSMPRIPEEQRNFFPPFLPGQHYPYVRDGWEAYKVDGTKQDPNTPQATQSVGLIRAYGTFYQKAGYWPGSYADGDAATGLLVDEASWSFDTTSTSDATWDPYSAEKNLVNPLAGRIYAMVYCDEQINQDVYFIGRIFRAEPASAGGSN